MGLFQALRAQEAPESVAQAAPESPPLPQHQASELSHFKACKGTLRPVRAQVLNALTPGIRDRVRAALEQASHAALPI